MRRKRPCLNEDRSNKDIGTDGYAMTTDLYAATIKNTSPSAAIWTGKHLSVTVMNIMPMGESGLTSHPDGDRIIQAVSGRGIVKMGTFPYRPGITEMFGAGCAVFIPAGVWYNIINSRSTPLKLCCIGAPASSEKDRQASYVSVQTNTKQINEGIEEAGPFDLGINSNTTGDRTQDTDGSPL